MTERSLQDFFDSLRLAQQANRAKFPVWYDIIERIDRCFVRAGENLVKLQSPMTGAFLLRCQYAFKTAAGIALAGQVVEVFVVLRSVLEYAGYCLTIYDRPGHFADRGAGGQIRWLSRLTHPTQSSHLQLRGRSRSSSVLERVGSTRCRLFPRPSHASGLAAGRRCRSLPALASRRAGPPSQHRATRCADRAS
jgi:hypothetical protein